MKRLIDIINTDQVQNTLNRCNHVYKKVNVQGKTHNFQCELCGRRLKRIAK